MISVRDRLKTCHPKDSEPVVNCDQFQVKVYKNVKRKIKTVPPYIRGDSFMPRGKASARTWILKLLVIPDS